MTSYLHRVQYYETDAMGVVHHSNYIRWMEEVREVFLDEAGMPYAEMETSGLYSPVIAVSCRYRFPARFGDTVRIETALTEFGNVRFCYRYRMVDAASGKVLVTGESEHCFLNREGRPVSLKRKNPALYDKFAQLVEKEP